MKSKRRPNILFIMADQWAAASVRCYNPALPAVTPALDALAARGMRFNRHYANVPVCGPSRACIFSGRSPVATGVFHNNIERSPDTPFFTQHLQAAGYRTLGVGKFHFTPMQLYPPDGLLEYGFDEALITEDPKHGPWLEWVRWEHPEAYERALAVSWPVPFIESYPPDGRNLRPQWQQAWEKHVRPRQQAPNRRIFYPSPLPAELHQTSWITDRAVDMLEANQGAEQPFFLFVSYVDPHDPYDPPAPYDTLFEPADIPAPVPQEWSRKWCSADYARFQDTMFQLSSFDRETWARLRAYFYGSCRFVDDNIGRLLKQLNRLGLEEDTLVIFTTDHGDLIGDHGLLMKGPWHYDQTVRCPLIVAGPEVSAGMCSEELSCTLDLAPTILRAAQVEVPSVGGKVLPLSPGIGHDCAPWTEIVLESNASYVNLHGGCRTIISEDGWRLTLFPDAEYGELFNLCEDPNEQENLFLKPEVRERRLSMSEALVRGLARQIYPWPRGEYSAF